MTTHRPSGFGNLFFTGMVLPQREGGAVPPSLDAQLDNILAQLEAVLDVIGGSVDDVLAIYSYHLDLWSVERILSRAQRIFSVANPPAWTPVVCSGLSADGVRMAMKFVIDTGPEERVSIRLRNQGWQKALPVAALCRKGPLAFISGQTGVDAHGTVARPTSHDDQAEKAYRAIGDAIAAAGGSYDDILDFSSFHLDIRGADGTFKNVYVPQVIGNVSPNHAATCSHVGACALLRPGVIGTYSAIADLTPGRRSGSTPDAVWWKDSYPLAAATRKPNGRIITLAGHVAAAQDGSIVAAGDPEGQLTFILDAMAESLAGYGKSLDAIVDLTMYVKDIRFIDGLKEILASRFAAEHQPALSVAGIPGLWLEGFELEVAALAEP